MKIHACQLSFPCKVLQVEVHYKVGGKTVAGQKVPAPAGEGLLDDLPDQLSAKLW